MDIILTITSDHDRAYAVEQLLTLAKCAGFASLAHTLDCNGVETVKIHWRNGGCWTYSRPAYGNGVLRGKGDREEAQEMISVCYGHLGTDTVTVPDCPAPSVQIAGKDTQSKWINNHGWVYPKI